MQRCLPNQRLKGYVANDDLDSSIPGWVSWQAAFHLLPGSDELSPDSPLGQLLINAPTPVSGSILIVPYDRAWPGLYERERVRIVDALGARALSIDHFGSTSVPGLAAKPIIDIMLVVSDCADDEVYAPDLEASGYMLRIREPAASDDSPFHGAEAHRVFKGPDSDVNLHVWSRKSGEIERPRSFRDWLRVCPADRQLYERTKIELAKGRWDHAQQYADAKTAVIEEIRARAAHGS